MKKNMFAQTVPDKIFGRKLTNTGKFDKTRFLWYLFWRTF